MTTSIDHGELLIWTETDQLRTESFEETVRAQHKTIFEVENELYLAKKRIDELVAQLEQCNLFDTHVNEAPANKNIPKKQHIEELEPEEEEEPLSPIELKRNKVIADIRYYASLHKTKENNYKPSNASIASGTIHMPQFKYPLSLYPLIQKYGLHDLDMRYESNHFSNNVNLEKGQVLTCIYAVKLDCIYAVKNKDTMGCGYLLLPNRHDNEADYEFELLSYMLETYKNKYSCIASMIELSKLLDIEDLTTIQGGSTDRTILFECLKK